ncbi:chemotaxis protein CheW, partial [Pyxidicoccus sp. 3LG]
MSQVMEPEPAPREVLLFTLEGQRYGLPTQDVHELVRAARLTPLPRAPSVVEGLLNLRGTLLPVL